MKKLFLCSGRVVTRDGLSVRRSESLTFHLVWADDSWTAELDFERHMNEYELTVNDYIENITVSQAVGSPD